jgi:hypothetical protein
VYGLTTVLIAFLVARRAGMRWRALCGGLVAFAMSTSIYCVGNFLRFGDPFNPGYANSLSGAFVNRLTRWGLPFAKVPFSVAAKEMFATLFLLEPVSSQIVMGAPPASVRAFVVGERWREYYAPTFDLLVFAVWIGAFVIVCWRLGARRLWRRDRPLGGEVFFVVGAWALPPSVILFAFYARVGNLVTRYATDLYPAVAAASLCVGMAVVDAVRKRAPSFTGSAQLAIAAGVALYLAGWRGWATHLSHAVDRKAVVSNLANIDARGQEAPPVPDHFQCNEPRGQAPVYSHLDDWHPDCTFGSGMVFAMSHSRCVSFTFRAGGAAWGRVDEQSLAAFRANADFDSLATCGPPSIDGDSRRVTMCEPHIPSFLLDGMRLYSVASLDSNLTPIDVLRLTRIDSAPACP